jgi:hypothetical protein
MAEPARDPQDGCQKKTTPESIWSKHPWLRALLIWGAIGIFLLFFGGVAAQGYMRLMPCPAGTVCPAPHISKATLWGLAYLSVGGGVALGLIGVALTLANPRGPGWGFGIVVIGTLLFLVFVWPTPYKYYRVTDHLKEQRLIRVHRVTGDSDYVPKSKPPAAAAASANQN